jgi:hypothetical protein
MSGFQNNHQVDPEINDTAANHVLMWHCLGYKELRPDCQHPVIELVL